MNTTIKNLEKIADSIAEEAIIAYTQTTVLSPEEAFRLNNIIFEVARSEMFKAFCREVEEVTA